MNNKPEPMPLFEDDPADEHEDVTEPVSTPDDPITETPEDASAPVEGISDDVEPSVEVPEPAGNDGATTSNNIGATPGATAGAAASVAAYSVGSADEVDAWLSGGSQPAPDAWLSTDAEADAAMAAWLAADPNVVQVTEEGPVVVIGGRLERIRPVRRPFFPVWLIWVVLAVLLIGGAAAGTSAYLTIRARVFVPTVAGLQTPAARERLNTVGLTLAISDRRFSTLPVDTILAQTPEAGAKTKRGGTVTVVVSAGTEEFTMPDVVGVGLTLARSQLEQKGLEVQFETQISDQPSDTVLASNPSAGATVHTGDIVKLSVATGTSGTGGTGGSTQTTGTLVPYKLTGVRITLDPAPPVSGRPDSALDVTRRLRSLLEASGATVVSTRSITDTGTTSSTTSRQLRAREGSATVAIGFDVVSSGTAGVSLAYPNSSVATAAAAPSQTLASQMSSALSGQAINARQASGGSDVVLSATKAPYVRMTLGSTASREDLANFSDPNWADKVARATYQAVAAIYGIRNVGTF